MPSEVFEIQPADKPRGNRPANKAEKNQRRDENRAKVAAKHKVARSLRPNEWLQEECAEGVKEALVIRDEWKFKYPGDVSGYAEAGCTCAAAPLTAEQAERAALYQDHMVRAHAFGLKRAMGNDTLREAGQEQDAAQSFAVEIWRDLIDGKYEDQGKFEHYLEVRWGFFLDTIAQKLWDERNNFKGIQSESFSRTTGKPHGLEEGYVSEASASDWAHRADRAAELLKSHVDAQISKLSVNNQSLLELWLDMGGPTQEELAKEVGVSKRTIQRRLRAAQKEAAALNRKAAKVTSISKGLDFCAAAAEPGVVSISAAAEDSGHPDKLLTPPEAAEFLRIHPVTLLRWARQGKVPHKRLSARKILFPLSQLTAWLESESEYTDAAVRAA